LRQARLKVAPRSQRGEVCADDHGHRIAPKPRRFNLLLEVDELNRQVAQAHAQRWDIAGETPRPPRRAQVAEDRQGDDPASMPALDVVMVVEQAPGQGGVALSLHFDVSQPVGRPRRRRRLFG